MTEISSTTPYCQGSVGNIWRRLIGPPARLDVDVDDIDGVDGIIDVDGIIWWCLIEPPARIDIDDVDGIDDIKIKRQICF